MRDRLKSSARRCTRRTARDERGVSALEFAFIAPVLFALLFGIFEFGIHLHTAHQVRTAAREGARAAVVGTFGGDDSCTTVSSTGGEVICYTRDRLELDLDDVRVAVVVGPEGWTLGGSLAVCVQYQRDSITGLFGSILGDTVIEERAVGRIEDVEGAALISEAETALPGEDWSFCTAP